MPKEILEVKNFNHGIISSPATADIPTEAASFSFNLDSVTEAGKLKGIPEDKEILTGINATSGVMLKDDLIIYNSHQKKFVKLSDFDSLAEADENADFIYVSDFNDTTTIGDTAADEAGGMTCGPGSGTNTLLARLDSESVSDENRSFVLKYSVESQNSESAWHQINFFTQGAPGYITGDNVNISFDYFTPTSSSMSYLFFSQGENLWLNNPPAPLAKGEWTRKTISGVITDDPHTIDSSLDETDATWAGSPGAPVPATIKLTLPANTLLSADKDDFSIDVTNVDGGTFSPGTLDSSNGILSVTQGGDGVTADIEVTAGLLYGNWEGTITCKLLNGNYSFKMVLSETSSSASSQLPTGDYIYLDNFIVTRNMVESSAFGGANNHISFNRRNDVIYAGMGNGIPPQYIDKDRLSVNSELVAPGGNVAGSDYDKLIYAGLSGSDRVYIGWRKGVKKIYKIVSDDTPASNPVVTTSSEIDIENVTAIGVSQDFGNFWLVASTSNINASPGDFYSGEISSIGSSVTLTPFPAEWVGTVTFDAAIKDYMEASDDIETLDTNDSSIRLWVSYNANNPDVSFPLGAYSPFLFSAEIHDGSSAATELLLYDRTFPTVTKPNGHSGGSQKWKRQPDTMIFQMDENGAMSYEYKELTATLDWKSGSNFKPLRNTLCPAIAAGHEIAVGFKLGENTKLRRTYNTIDPISYDETYDTSEHNIPHRVCIFTVKWIDSGFDCRNGHSLTSADLRIVSYIDIDNIDLMHYDTNYDKLNVVRYASGTDLAFEMQTLIVPAPTATSEIPVILAGHTCGQEPTKSLVFSFQNDGLQGGHYDSGTGEALIRSHTDNNCDNAFIDIYKPLGDFSQDPYFFQDGTAGGIFKEIDQDGSNHVFEEAIDTYDGDESTISIVGSGSGSGVVGFEYKISYLYDGFQESPLIYTSFKPAAEINNDYISITIALEEGLIPERVTDILLYKLEGATYRFVDSVKKIHMSDDGAGGISKVFIDNGNSGASYEARTGCPQTMLRNIVNYGISEELNGELYVADATIPETEESAENYIFKSKPGNFSQFNWVTDNVLLPEKPTCIKGFNGRLFAFTENKIFRLNPEALYIEDIHEGIGCLNQLCAVTTEYGMFFIDRNGAYLHNGSSIQKLSMPIEHFHHDEDWTVDFSGFIQMGINQFDKNPDIPIKVSYEPKRGAFLVWGHDVKTIDGNNVSIGRVFAYNISQQRWDYWEAPLHQGLLMRDNGDTYIFTSGHKIKSYLNKVDEDNIPILRKWEFYSKKFTFGADTQEKVLSRIKLQGGMTQTVSDEADHSDTMRLRQRDADADVNAPTAASYTTMVPKNDYYKIKNNAAGNGRKVKNIQVQFLEQTEEMDAFGIIFRRRSIK